MADLLTADRWVLFLVFVVPGFVAMKMHDLLIPVAARDWSKVLIEVVSYSMLNLALLFPLVRYLNSGTFPDAHPWLYAVGMIFVLAVFPALLAVAARYLRVTPWLRRFVLDPSPTTWDYHFTQRRQNWVLIHFKDGKKLGGFFGKQSAASSYPCPQDVFLEQIWKVDDENRFVEQIDQTAGAVVSFEDCAAIEFFEVQSNDEQ